MRQQENDKQKNQPANDYPVAERTDKSQPREVEREKQKPEISNPQQKQGNQPFDRNQNQNNPNRQNTPNK